VASAILVVLTELVASFTSVTPRSEIKSLYGALPVVSDKPPPETTASEVNVAESTKLFSLVAVI
jgi:hypothetical protein